MNVYSDSKFTLKLIEHETNEMLLYLHEPLSVLHQERNK